MQINKQIHGLLPYFLVFRFNCDAPERIQAYKLLEIDNSQFFTLVLDVILLYIDNFEILVEAFHFTDGNALEVNISWVAQNLHKEVLFFNFSK